MAAAPKQVRRVENRAIPSGAGLIGYLGVGGREACHRESSATAENPLREIADFTLMPQGQHAHGIVLHHEAIKGNVSGSAKRNDEFAQVFCHAVAEQWV